MSPVSETYPQEKRSEARHGAEASIKWSYFNQKTCFNGKLINISDGGMSFETDAAIKPGATIFIKLETFPATDATSFCRACMRTISLAEVKWCQEKFRNEISRYGVGVKYPIPY